MEEVRTIKEECEEGSLPTCKQIHGPFDGENKIISKTFENMENHTKLALSLRLWRVDSWDRNDEVFVELFDSWPWTNGLHTPWTLMSWARQRCFPNSFFDDSPITK